MTGVDNAVPHGFEPDNSGGPFAAHVGPLYTRVEADGSATRGMRIVDYHLNSLGVVHGGVLMAFVDFAVTRAIMETLDWQPHLSTNINTTFVSSAQIGDWLEGRCEITRAGRRMIFVRAVITSGARVVMTGEANALKIDKPHPERAGKADG